MATSIIKSIKTFQSTPSARRATSTRGRFCRASPISIHALREEGDRVFCDNHVAIVISIHALREEGDSRLCAFCNSGQRFQSTPSARRATSKSAVNDCWCFISIHALREEGDQVDALCLTCRYVISIHALREEGDISLPPDFTKRFYFNPRPPRGGRRMDERRQRRNCKFQSTPSARRATATRRLDHKN